jgi:ABC-type branched-subunit amino acid transport system substrate-binding protein
MDDSIRRRRRGVALLVALVLLGAACRSSSDGGNQADAGSSTTTTAAKAAATGDFGDLKAVCGPGDAKGATARGVTDTEIHVSTMGDPSNTAAPGLGQEFFDTADAFVKWCNDAGGILGRKLVLTKRDSKLFEVGARMVEACQSDFFLVGNGTPLDVAGVQPRLACKLGMMPAYVVSATAVAADQQVQVNGIPLDEYYVGLFRRIAEKFPEEWKHVVVTGSALPDLRPTYKKSAEAVEATGGHVVVTEELPSAIDNWRPYVQKWKAAGAQVLVGSNSSAGNLAAMLQAAKEVGLDIKLMVTEVSSYRADNAQVAARGDVTVPPMYILMNAWPTELADENPTGATSQLAEIIDAATPGAKLGFSHMQGWNAWLLFATAARDCGSDLTETCVLQKGEHEVWTGGGLFAPRPVSQKDFHTNRCVMNVVLTKDGYQFSKELTQPNDDSGYFNCDPKNVINVKTYLNE